MGKEGLALIKKAKRVYIIGNGGSYANAIHVCNDLNNCGIRAFTLDPATLTATANDDEYAAIFSKWVAHVGDPGDLLIALSGSGRSPNILRAIRTAKRKRMHVLHVTWRLKGSMDMQASEEAQLVLGHYWMKKLRGRR